ncbi:hypothetical protein IGS73_02200 [Janibacter indicus]|uniref:Anti-bacteriophage protein A/HamA C-terminal domain-containing protein n=1 Tax=Janibacter indicus TaxID=857417 RepID=A0A7L9J0T6_9MICO|nr:hypothetical protein [Janibacter indicus]QOK23261.1 hypothetical protein IGS73_02200 [Janibacter indicus]
MTSSGGSKTPLGKQRASALADLSAGESEEFARTHRRLVVHDYLPVTFHDGVAGASKCEWSSHIAASLTPEQAGALAWVLIDTMMRARFGPATSLYDTWREHTIAGTKIPSPDKETIESFIEPVFGLPDAPKSEDHLQGHVGEWLWHLLTKDNVAVRIQPDPKGDVTDAGADGFSIYENAAGTLRFRLWESKKNTGTGSLSTSLNQAYEQLAASGQRYVAKIVGTFMPGFYDDEILTFIAEVPAAWTQGDELVGAGVTLATHQPLPSKPFNKMSKKLPLLNKPGQLRGLVTSISCYDELSSTVRRYAWTAL